MAPVIRRLRDLPGVRTSIATSGQHHVLLDQVMEFFEIKADFKLDVMRGRQTLSELYAKLLLGLQPVIDQTMPTAVVVHGDTATTFAAAMSSFYAKTPVAHVEAGLRTNNLNAPWPEESNRRLTAVLANLHFAPTDSAKEALIAEGHAEDAIWVTGNTVIDALMDAVEAIDNRPCLRRRISEVLPPMRPQTRRILVTGHRRENFDHGLASLCRALNELAARGDVEIVFPIHLNPVVQDIVHGAIGRSPVIHLLPPLDYPTFVAAMRSSHLILTDSGGIQEEAPSLGKPVLVLRETTERPEAVEAGTVKVIGTQTDRIVAETSKILDCPEAYARMARAHNPYGDGLASERIVQILQTKFGG
jgi:UDP-N-acetylglucosamine 2-epimerase (non-hydrolysing)